MAYKHLATPAAIVVAGTLIGVGSFFGLREHTREAPALSVASVAGPNSPSTRPAEEASSPARAATLRENVTAQIASVLAARKAGLIDQCWKPNAAAAPPGQSSHWTFNFTIGADGGQITRGVTEAHDSSRPEITACVLGALEPLSVSPPGAMVVVDVPFELP